MPIVKCRGVSIDFPFEPYSCQHDYMSKVLECLQLGTNGILESPTGTGKTLCLLCSTLAWRNAYISQQELGRCLQGSDVQGKGDEGGFRQSLATELKQGAGGSRGEGQEGPGMFLDRPRIIYASRTHSQLSQAVSQLKDTTYRPRVAVIGSREQLCIHPEVQKADTNAAKVHMCKAKVNSRTCNFYNNLDQKKADKAFTDNILDIEDLVKLGNTHKVCPYYMARELKANADLVFMPYNYLLDSKSRRIHGVELQGNVVIFDEAHNVERMCEESASFDLSSFDLASCVEEVDHLLNKTIEIESCNQPFRADSAGEEGFDASALATLKKLFLDLEAEIDNTKPPEAGLTKPGSFIYEFFAKVHITFDSKVEILQLLDKIISQLTTSSTVFHNKAAGLQKFCDILNTIFSKESPSASVTEASRCYKVHIRASAPQKKGRADLWTSGSAAKNKKQGYTLNYWCFSPGASMKELVSQGVRSIILTSGTLSPLRSFKSELQIDFPVQLENPHVIGKHQMTVAVMTKGPDGTVLNSSYNTRFNRDYVMSLGNAIVNFSRLVPNGLLVFFPSYPVMNHCLEQWQSSGIHHRISQYKEVFVEPRGKVDFIQTMEAFYEKINDPKLNGACFFAVCRGKVSEGLDFADINGRAVVITGLPFPPRMDPRIVLKMQYLDESRRRNQSSLSGQDWYRQQASRAVNQAIGRVIRHKDDFGAILLCDTRFSNRDARSQLPAWVRPYTNVYDQFGKAIRDLTNFFKETERTMPKPQPKQAQPSGPVPIDQAQCRQLPQPSSSSTSTAPRTKAKYIDTHVPSLTRNRDGSHVSEAQLKIMYEDARTKPVKKAAGLLDALSNVENTHDNQTDGFLSPRGSQSESQQSSRLQHQDKKKRKKIVIKQPNGPTSSLDKAGKPSPDTRLASAQEYIAKVKKTLSIESYKTFSSVMQAYKQDDNFMQMLIGIAELFAEDEANYPLFRNFYTFARPHHKEDFHKICLSLTGQGCGYKREHSFRFKKVVEKVEKCRHPKALLPSKSIGAVKSCQPGQSLPSAAKGMTTSKDGDPMKSPKYDSINASTSIDRNVLGEENIRVSSHLLVEEMGGRSSAAFVGMSSIQSVQLSAEFGTNSGAAEDSEVKVQKASKTSGEAKTSGKASGEAGTSVKTSRDAGTSVETSGEAGTSVKTSGEAGTSVKTSGEAETSVKASSEAGTAVKTSGEAGTSVKTSGEAGTSVKTSGEAGNFVKASGEAGTSVKTTGEAGTSVKTTGEAGTSVKTSGEAGTSVKTSGEAGTSVKASGEAGTSVKTSGEAGTNVKTPGEAGTSVKTSSEAGTSVKTSGEAGTAVKTSGEAQTSLKTSVLEGASIQISLLEGTSIKTSLVEGTSVKTPDEARTSRDAPEDSPNEDEEEPMSLEASTDDNDVLDASKELFEDSPSESTEKPSQIFQENKAITMINKGTPSVETGSPTESHRDLHPIQGDQASSSKGDSSACATHDNLASGLSLVQGSKRSRIQKMINQVKRNIVHGSTCGEDLDGKSGKGGGISNRTGEEIEDKDSVNQSDFNGHSRLHSEAQSLEESERTTICSSGMKVKKKGERLPTRTPESPITGFKKNDLVACKDSKRPEKNQSCVVESKEHPTEKRFRIKSSKCPAHEKMHSSDEVLSIVTKKLSKNLDEPNISGIAKDTSCLTPSRKKSKNVDSPRSKSSTSHQEFRSTKNLKTKSTTSERSSVMPSRKRQADSSPEMSHKKKIAKAEMKQNETHAVTERTFQAKSSESRSPSQKTERSSKVEVGGKHASSKAKKSTDSPRRSATSKSKKDKLTCPESARKKTVKKVKPSVSAGNEASPHQERSGKKGQAELAGGSWVSKQSFIEKSASQSRRKRTDVDCALCKNKAWPAYQGPCGHICCQTCWQEYIREFQECPDCGAETSEQHLIPV